MLGRKVDIPLSLFLKDKLSCLVQRKKNLFIGICACCLSQVDCYRVVMLDNGIFSDSLLLPPAFINSKVLTLSGTSVLPPPQNVGVTTRVFLVQMNKEREDA